MPKKSAKKIAPPADESPIASDAALKPKKTRAKKTTVPEAAPETAPDQLLEKPAKKKRASAKPRTAKVAIKDEAGVTHEVNVPVGASIIDPIGGVIDGEAHAAEPPAQNEARANSDELPEHLHDDAKRSEPVSDAKLERLQKVLSQAGIASRRHAEEMIVAGRVMVNGQLVTQLGAKADPTRDHIRVDGKLLAGPERHRYFVLNKPRGYVTTASDPEGRQTVMQFFDKMPLRLYPVGRLDYLSEGLLLVTNDGELAHQLTRAAAGVEKTYLVKVAGQPTQEELERLRSGVSIERGARGTERVDTAPAQVREIRHGDNPWFEVVLIEGRNRELRKMFEQIGHHVEKIRRVGYGPLVLDVEPGKFRELTPEEVKVLQLTAEGKLKPRRPRASQMVPQDAGRPAEEGKAKSYDRKPFARQSDRAERPPRRNAGPGFKPRFENDKPKRFESERPNRFGGPKREGFGAGKRESFGGAKRESFGTDPERTGAGGPKRFSGEKRERFGGRPERFNERPQFPRSESRSFDARRADSNRSPSSDSSRGQGRENYGTDSKPRFEKRPFGARPQRRDNDREASPRREFEKPGARPEFRRADRPFNRRSNERPDRPRFDRGERPDSKRSERPAFDRGSKPKFERSDRPRFDRSERPASKRPDRPAFKPAGRRDDRPAGATAEPWIKKPGSERPNESSSRPPIKRFSSRPSSGPPSGKRSFSRGPGKPSFRPGTKSGNRPGPRPGGRPGSRPGNRKRG